MVQPENKPKMPTRDAARPKQPEQASRSAASSRGAPLPATRVRKPAIVFGDDESGLSGSEVSDSGSGEEESSEVEEDSDFGGKSPKKQSAKSTGRGKRASAKRSAPKKSAKRKREEASFESSDSDDSGSSGSDSSSEAHLSRKGRSDAASGRSRPVPKLRKIVESSISEEESVESEDVQPTTGRSRPKKAASARAARGGRKVGSTSEKAKTSAAKKRKIGEDSSDENNDAVPGEHSEASESSDAEERSESRGSESEPRKQTTARRSRASAK